MEKDSDEFYVKKRLSMNKSNIGKIAFIIIALCLFIQVFLIISFGDYKQLSDYGEYIKLAQGCLDRKSWGCNLNCVKACS